jgi:hypothetical protein
VEGCFGIGKRKFLLDLIVAWLSNDAELYISMAFVVMRAEYIWRLIRLFFIIILPGCAPSNGRLSLDVAQIHLKA